MTSPDPKIIDLINTKKEGDVPFTSLEFFPPRSEEGVTVRPINEKYKMNLQNEKRKINRSIHFRHSRNFSPPHRIFIPAWIA